MSESILPSELPQRFIQNYTFEQLRENQELLNKLDTESNRTFAAEYGEHNTATSYTDVTEEGNGLITVIRDGEKLVGSGIIRFYEPDHWGKGTAASQEITHVYVIPEEQRKGHGSALVDEQLRLCVERGGNTWAILNRGAKQLEMYRTKIEEKAKEQGKSVAKWSGDATTQSYAYAYIENNEEKNARVIFQGRTPNGPLIYRSAITAPDITLSPDSFQSGGILSELTIRRDFGGHSKSVGVSATEFDLLQQNVQEKCSLADDRALDGGFPQVLSVTID